MESINNNNDNKKKESKKTYIWSIIYSGISIVGDIMLVCLLYALSGWIIAFSIS